MQDPVEYLAISNAYEKMENMQQAMRFVRLSEFGEDACGGLENEGEAMRAIEGKSSDLGKVHAAMVVARSKFADDLYGLVREYIYANGEDKSVRMLIGLKNWHPWSYKYF